METQVVSFDADGTIVSSGYVNQFWFRELPEIYADENGVEIKEAREALVELYDEVGDEDIRWYLPEYWFDRLSLDPEPEEIIERIKVPENVDLYTDAVQAINELEVDYRLVVTSNAPRVFLDYALERVRDSFDEVYSCVSDFGEVKKDESVYRRVAGLIGVEGKEMAHVGDHWKFDYEVPRKIGIDSFYIDRNGEREYDSNSRILEDMRDMVDRLEG
ncbi:HAD family hydrolase [Candidatus Bipolaricaulota bacterium]|nr:HAD family hydrolase [Candidatus Bipolaricaulota bacterium]